MFLNYDIFIDRFFYIFVNINHFVDVFVDNALNIDGPFNYLLTNYFFVNVYYFLAWYLYNFLDHTLNYVVLVDRYLYNFFCFHNDWFLNLYFAWQKFLHFLRYLDINNFLHATWHKHIFVNGLVLKDYVHTLYLNRHFNLDVSKNDLKIFI
jgi:hypothetical protein